MHSVHIYNKLSGRGTAVASLLLTDTLCDSGKLTLHAVSVTTVIMAL